MQGLWPGIKWLKFHLLKRYKPWTSLASWEGFTVLVPNSWSLVSSQFCDSISTFFCLLCIGRLSLPQITLTNHTRTSSNLLKKMWAWNKAYACTQLSQCDSQMVCLHLETSACARARIRVSTAGCPPSVEHGILGKASRRYVVGNIHGELGSGSVTHRKYSIEPCKKTEAEARSCSDLLN